MEDNKKTFVKKLKDKIKMFKFLIKRFNENSVIEEEIINKGHRLSVIKSDYTDDPYTSLPMECYDRRFKSIKKWLKELSVRVREYLSVTDCKIKPTHIHTLLILRNEINRIGKKMTPKIATNTTKTVDGHSISFDEWREHIRTEILKQYV